MNFIYTALILILPCTIHFSEIINGQIIKSTSETAINEVTIGKQTWSNKNVDAVTFRNGDTIPEAKTDYDWQKPEPHWCYYDNNPENGPKYGKLYNWFAVTDSRGIAPVGWHVPNSGEWMQLTVFLGGDWYAGAKLKSTTAWNNNKNNTNLVGFDAIPAGYRYYDGAFAFKNSGFWWTTTESLFCQMNSGTISVMSRQTANKKTGLSIRLVKD